MATARTATIHALCPLALAAALALALALAPAQAATRYWTFVGGCASADWLGVTAGPNSQGQLTCWSDSPIGVSGQAAPGINDDVFIIAPAATQTLLVNLSAPGRSSFSALARNLTMYGSSSFAAGLNVDRQTLVVQTMTLGAAGQSVLGRVDQSAGSVSATSSLNLFGGDYNLSGGSLSTPLLNLRSQTAGARFTQSGGTLTAGSVALGSNLGFEASFSQLAGTVTSSSLDIGSIAGSGSGVFVSGSDTRWDNIGNTVVGNLGKAVLEVRGGAHMSTATATLGAAAGNTGRVTVDGAGSTWAVAGALAVGGAGYGRLEVSGGGLVSAVSVVFNGPPAPPGQAEPGSAGSFGGSGTRLDIGGTTTVGRVSGATLDVFDGAVVTQQRSVIGDGATGLLRLSGSGGAAWNSGVSLVVGNTGSGRVEVGAGNTLHSTAATLGAGAGSSGSVALSGALAAWFNDGAVTVGQGGAGSVTLAGGARLQSGSVLLADAASSSAAFGVDGQGTSWQNGGELVLGRAGSASLGVTGRGSVHTDSLRLGDAIGGRGTLGVAGSGSKVEVVHGLTVGGAGTGSVAVSGGAGLSALQLTLGELAGGSGSLTMSGAPGTFTGLSVDSLIIGQAGQGTMLVNPASNAYAGNIVLGQSAGAVGTLGLQGDELQGANLYGSGSIVVGNAGSGVLRIDGWSSLTSGDARIGVAAGSSGEVTVASTGYPPRTASWAVGALEIGGAGRGVLTIGTEGRVTASGLTRVGGNGRLVLDSGFLVTAAAALGDPVRLDWRSGTLRITGTGGAALDGQSLPTLLVLQPGRTLHVDQMLRLGGDSTLLLSGGVLAAGTLSLDNAVLAATGGNALAMDGIQLLVGAGQVGAAVQGGAASVIRAAGGALTLGLLSRSDGFAFAGTLDAADQQVLLLDRDWAQLGSLTHLGSGGRLVSVNGALLTPGASLLSDGDASVQGRFVNDGDVAALHGQLSFVDDVSGSGSFSGAVRFLAGYAPGAAQVGFGHGSVDFGANARLTLDIDGTTPGAGFDRLADIGTLSFDGVLTLAFGSGFSAAPGTRLALLDFDAFAGRLDTSRIVVTGFDAARLDLTRLGIDGTLTISAVPEPSSWALWAAGLAAVVARRRRQTSSANSPVSVSGRSKP